MLTVGPSEIILNSTRGIRNDIHLSYYFRLTRGSFSRPFSKGGEVPDHRYHRPLLYLPYDLASGIPKFHSDFASGLPEST